jgi:hypothetical protein
VCLKYPSRFNPYGANGQPARLNWKFTPLGLSSIAVSKRIDPEDIKKKG